MKFILIFLLGILVIGCDYGPAPSDAYCTEQCIIYFEKPIEGSWLGDDIYLDITRCLCLNSEQGTHHMFPRMNRNGN